MAKAHNYEGWSGHVTMMNSYEATQRSVAVCGVTAHRVSPHPKTISKLKGIELIAAQSMMVYLDLMKWEIITAWHWPIAHLSSLLSAHTKTLLQKIQELLYVNDILRPMTISSFQSMSPQRFFVEDHTNFVIYKIYIYFS